MKAVFQIKTVKVTNGPFTYRTHRLTGSPAGWTANESGSNSERRRRRRAQRCRAGHLTPFREGRRFGQNRH
jgi:hypothetical protein